MATFNFPAPDFSIFSKNDFPYYAIVFEYLDAYHVHMAKCNSPGLGPGPYLNDVPGAWGNLPCVWSLPCLPSWGFCTK